MLDFCEKKWGLYYYLIEPSQQHYVADTITIPILQMKKLKLKPGT